MSVLVLGLTRTDRYSVFAEWSLRTIFGSGSVIIAMWSLHRTAHERAVLRGLPCVRAALTARADVAVLDKLSRELAARIERLVLLLPVLRSAAARWIGDCEPQNVQREQSLQRCHSLSWRASFVHVVAARYLRRAHFAIWAVHLRVHRAAVGVQTALQQKSHAACGRAIHHALDAWDCRSRYPGSGGHHERWRRFIFMLGLRAGRELKAVHAAGCSS